METAIIELITKYGLNTVIIATITFCLTGLIKIPIKALAKKINDSAKITKYITFLPIVLSLMLTAIYKLVFFGTVCFDGNFLTLWFSSSSLSLAIYAFKEKFLPSQNSVKTKSEIEQNLELIEKIKEVIKTKNVHKEETALTQEDKEDAFEKIILRGSGNGEVIKTENQRK